MFLTLKAISEGGLTSVTITNDEIPYNELEHPVDFMQYVLDRELLIPIYTEITVHDLPTVKKWLCNAFNNALSED